MTRRIGWLADPETEDSYSAREARLVMRALSRLPNVIPIWFAVGSKRPPHMWDGVRVIPIPDDALGPSTSLQRLMAQQRPGMIVSNLPRSSLVGFSDCLKEQGDRWIHRVNPIDMASGWRPKGCRGLVIGNCDQITLPKHCMVVPHLWNVECGVLEWSDVNRVLCELMKAVLDPHVWAHARTMSAERHLVMRQHLFHNLSVSQVMFELTNALLELGVPAVPQDEFESFCKEAHSNEMDLYRSGAREKYDRVCRHLDDDYDPESAVTVHFTLFRPGVPYAANGRFSSLSGRDVLYSTGNHTVSANEARILAGEFENVIVPSQHVLRPYLEAGLPRRQAAVIPHGVDPTLFSPDRPPFAYPSKKGFKFLQTSFPWVAEKGFDVTVAAFCKAFSSQDDVSLVLRIPCVKDGKTRADSTDRLAALVRQAQSKPGAPEILLLEEDVPFSRRATLYAGANCYVHPLRAEGFGMTILEAMACGLPVIATAWSGPADFLSSQYAHTLRHSWPVPERNRSGAILRYHVEPDLDHLVFLMRYAYDHQDEGKVMGQRAAQAARERWTWSHVSVCTIIEGAV